MYVCVCECSSWMFSLLLLFFSRLNMCKTQYNLLLTTTAVAIVMRWWWTKKISLHFKGKNTGFIKRWIRWIERNDTHAHQVLTFGVWQRQQSAVVAVVTLVKSAGSTCLFDVWSMHAPCSSPLVLGREICIPIKQKTLTALLHMCYITLTNYCGIGWLWVYAINLFSSYALKYQFLWKEQILNYQIIVSFEK